MSWDKMARHKHSGSLGFKHLRDFNLAMLGKVCWRFITNEDSLVTRVYKARYYADKNFLEASFGNSHSSFGEVLLRLRRSLVRGRVGVLVLGRLFLFCTNLG